MRQSFNFDSFDKIAFGAIAAVLVIIIAIVFAGDNVGVSVESYFPENAASYRDTIHIRFYDPMSQSSVEQHFNITPPLEGIMRWNGVREFVFEPSLPLTPGETYTVSVTKGAVSRNHNRSLKEDFQFSFRVSLPVIVYIAPATQRQNNLFSYNLNTGEIAQLTHTEHGIADFAVHPDGISIVYTAYQEDGTGSPTDLWLYDVQTNSIRQLTDCANSYCVAPVWSPDGTQIVYEREDYDQLVGFVGARRMWVVNPDTAVSRQLFQDTQIVGNSPQFSPLGNKVAILSYNPPGILIYDYETQQTFQIPSTEGIVGDFSPDGSQLIYPVLMDGEGPLFYNNLEVIDLATHEKTPALGASDASFDYKVGSWNPNGRYVAVLRRPLDELTSPVSQVYLLDIENHQVSPLITDEGYSYTILRWSADGSLLVMQRFNYADSNAKPEIWLYQMQSGELQQIAVDAYLPSFFPLVD